LATFFAGFLALLAFLAGFFFAGFFLTAIGNTSFSD